MNLDDFNLEDKKIQVNQEGQDLILSAFIKGNDSGSIQGTPLSKEELQALRAEFLNEVSQNPENYASNFASQLMMNGQYKECIAYYLAIAEQYPHKRGLSESQIGAAYYFLGNYVEAIKYYLQARDNGMNPDMMDDNIWEACETIYQKTNDLVAIEQYLNLCPKGKFIENAKILLN
jgi:tetratricopeptide (TPR) repeat protein